MDLRKWDIAALIRCENEACRGVSFRHELEQNNWNCPYCGKPVSKPEGPPDSEGSLKLCQ